MEQISDKINSKNAKLSQVRTFCSVMFFGSVTETAKFHNISQPAVSLQIQSLETELGVSLFNRDGRNLTPTDAARDFFNLILPTIARFDVIYDGFRASHDSNRRNILIGANDPAISYILSHYIGSFATNNPNVIFDITNVATQEVGEQMLLSDKLDILIFPTITPDPRLFFIPLRQYKTILIAGKNHKFREKFLKKEAINFADIQACRLARLDDSAVTLPFFVNLLKNHSIEAQIVVSGGSWEHLKNIVRNSDSVAFVADVCLSNVDRDLLKFDISNYFPRLEYGIMLRNGNILPRSTKSFVSHVLNYENNNPSPS